MKSTRRDIGNQLMQDIEWEQIRERARRKQKYLKTLMAIHAKKKAAPNGNSEAADK